MTRRWFSFLVPTAAAAQTRTNTRDVHPNNECPVCGTMAKPYRTAKGADRNRSENLTRCLHCNAAFWQDAE